MKILHNYGEVEPRVLAVAGAGAVLYIAPNEEHRIENTGVEPLRIVCLVPPFAPEL